MKYEGYKIGPVIRNVRKGKGLLLDDVATKTGISVSTLGQVEQGGRNLSMKNLYMLMDVYNTDANTLLAIDTTSDSLDSKLRELPVDKQEYLRKTFDFMIEQISGVVVANMAAVSSSLADAYYKVGLIIEAGGVVATVDEGRLDMHIKEVS